MREIRPRFLTNEKVSLMSDNKIIVNRDNFSNTYLEEKLFKTKQELLNSL